MRSEPTTRELHPRSSIVLALVWACLFGFRLGRIVHDFRFDSQEGNFWLWGDLVVLLICAMLSVLFLRRVWQFIPTSAPGRKLDAAGQQQTSLN